MDSEDAVHWGPFPSSAPEPLQDLWIAMSGIDDWIAGIESDPDVSSELEGALTLLVELESKYASVVRRATSVASQRRR